MMTLRQTALAALMGGLAATAAAPAADETMIRIDPSRVVHRVSPYLYGACIEDVNHEIYGGIYSQMLFGESFQEPPPSRPIAEFTALGGDWRAEGGVVSVGPGDGPKLVADAPPTGDGEVSAEVRFTEDRPGNAGLIVRVDRPGIGADTFTGYEVSLETSGRLVLGRHRRNWEPIRTVPCAVPIGRWIALAVRMTGRTIEVVVDGRSMLRFHDDVHPLGPGGVGLRVWQRPASFRNLRTRDAAGVERRFPLEPKAGDGHDEGVSGAWRALTRGSVAGSLTIETREPFKGRQSQRIHFREGSGQIGVENRGLNRWGLTLVAGKPYEGYVWARAPRPTSLITAMESGDGARVVATARLEIAGDAWTRYDFTLTPDANLTSARLALKLDRPGSVDLGHAFLQPGPWGRFRGLPDRRDVVEGLIDQGVSVLRYGGSMVNHPAYRWKNMIGPRDRRPITPGWWYPYSSNGWGIFDFLELCEAMTIPGIPAVQMGESPDDMADFVEYANGPADSPWGRRRAADGHPEPYRLRHLELGNEEAVNDAYWDKFRPMAEAIWAKDPAIILVVGDFAYNRVIVDPDRFEGGVAVNTLAAHRKILNLAKARGREVWFDIHISTDHPPEPGGLLAERSYIDALAKVSPGANYKVVIFEYNSGNHAIRRALSNAWATNEVERIGDRLPIACAANCLQPDGQNDNGWDQGLLFLNPSKVWLQPPGYTLRMAQRGYQPLLVVSEVVNPPSGFSLNTKRSEDGKRLVLQVVNTSEAERPARIDLGTYRPASPSATVETLSGPLDGANPATQTDRIVPVRSEWRHGLDRGPAAFVFPPRSFTVIHLE